MPNENKHPISENRADQDATADCRKPSGIVRHSTLWMTPPFGVGEPKKVEAKPEIVGPLMVAGWSQCEPPAADQEVTGNVG